jgi:hypothetical protein
MLFGLSAALSGKVVEVWFVVFRGEMQIEITSDAEGAAVGLAPVCIPLAAALQLAAGSG